MPAGGEAPCCRVNPDWRLATRRNAQQLDALAPTECFQIFPVFLFTCHDATDVRQVQRLKGIWRCDRDGRYAEAPQCEAGNPKIEQVSDRQDRISGACLPLRNEEAARLCDGLCECAIGD